MTQTCATCIYGDGERCHWPYTYDQPADADHSGIWDADVGDAPTRVYEAIERAAGDRVNAKECAECDTFEERDEEAATEEPERCPDSLDMFGGEA